MTMDIQKIISDIIEKLTSDEDLLGRFKADPVKTLEKAVNIDLPDDQIEAVIKAIQTKLNLDSVSDAAEKLLGGLGGLFGKK